MVKEDCNVGGNVFPRRLDRPMPLVGKAEGVWIEDTEGRRYLDASGGAVVVNVGHCREEIARAVFEQICTYDYIHPTMFTTPVVETFATALASHTPAGLDRFYFLSGGAEGVERPSSWLEKSIWQLTGRKKSVWYPAGNPITV